jgi:monofunctional biosynthetic peptidoglycan transglycosylase
MLLMRRWLCRVMRIVLLLVLGCYSLCLLGLAALRFIPPLTTAVQIQRGVEAWWTAGVYTRRYQYVPLSQIADHLEHAVVAAEDARFFTHWGFDWHELARARAAAQQHQRPMRGASTITQQLVKNLFLTTHRSYLRKALEYTLTPWAELLLGKPRILELYLNVVEWGPGVYGAEAAARYYYQTSAAALTRERAARLAAVLPAPRRRTPQRLEAESARILARMRQMGW